MQTQITEWSTALMTSLAGAMMLFFSAVPKIIGFLAIVIVDKLIASVIAKAQQKVDTLHDSATRH